MRTPARRLYAGLGMRMVAVVSAIALDKALAVGISKYIEAILYAGACVRFDVPPSTLLGERPAPLAEPVLSAAGADISQADQSRPRKKENTVKP